MEMVLYFFFFVVVAERVIAFNETNGDLKNNDNTLNIPAEDNVENNFNSDGDKQYVTNNMRTEVNNVKTPTCFDHLISIIKIFNKYDDDGMERLIGIIDEQVNTFLNDDHWKYHELQNNDKLRKFVAKRLDEAVILPISEVRKKSFKLVTKVEHEKPTKQQKDLIQIFNSACGDDLLLTLSQIISKFNEFRLKKVKDYLQLTKFVKQGLGLILLDDINDRDVRTRSEVKFKLNIALEALDKLLDNYNDDDHSVFEKFTVSNKNQFKITTKSSTSTDVDKTALQRSNDNKHKKTQKQHKKILSTLLTSKETESEASKESDPLLTSNKVQIKTVRSYNTYRPKSSNQKQVPSEKRKSGFWYPAPSTALNKELTTRFIIKKVILKQTTSKTTINKPSRTVTTTAHDTHMSTDTSLSSADNTSSLSSDELILSRLKHLKHELNSFENLIKNKKTTKQERKPINNILAHRRSQLRVTTKGDIFRDETNLNDDYNDNSKYTFTEKQGTQLLKQDKNNLTKMLNVANTASKNMHYKRYHQYVAASQNQNSDSKSTTRTFVKMNDVKNVRSSHAELDQGTADSDNTGKFNKSHAQLSIYRRMLDHDKLTKQHFDLEKRITKKQNNERNIFNSSNKQSANNTYLVNYYLNNVRNHTKHKNEMRN